MLRFLVLPVTRNKCSILGIYGTPCYSPVPSTAARCWVCMRTTHICRLPTRVQHLATRVCHMVLRIHVYRTPIQPRRSPVLAVLARMVLLVKHVPVTRVLTSGCIHLLVPAATPVATRARTVVTTRVTATRVIHSHVSALLLLQVLHVSILSGNN